MVYTIAVNPFLVELMMFLQMKLAIGRELTGNPTATLSSAILFVPACKLTGPVNVNLIFSRVP